MPGLGAAGRYAERQMRERLTELGMVAPPGAVSRYAFACDRLARLRAAWEQLGAPATAPGSRGQATAHPLLAELRMTEATVSELCAACGVKAPTASVGWPKGRQRSRAPVGQLVSFTDRLTAP